MRFTTEVEIPAPPPRVMAVYLDWRRWPEVFPRIHAVRLVTVEAGTTVVDVDHDEGRVRNWLRPLSPVSWELRETKRRYSAHFLHHVERRGDGTVLQVDTVITLHGVLGLVDTPLRHHARAQLRAQTLLPLRAACSAVDDK